MSPTQAPPTSGTNIHSVTAHSALIGGCSLVNTYCQTGWDQYGDRCYWYSNSNQATYATARASCQGKHAELVSINSVYEQAYLLSTLRGKGNMWLGLNDQVTEGEYVWTDGSDVTSVGNYLSEL